VLKGNFMQGNEVTIRILWLIENDLKKITSDSSGWETLYVDLADNRLWELTYSQSQMHAGGPPSLINITRAEAKRKYAYSR
jgi:hypothetical protein